MLSKTTLKGNHNLAIYMVIFYIPTHGYSYQTCCAWLVLSWRMMTKVHSCHLGDDGPTMTSRGCPMMTSRRRPKMTSRRRLMLSSGRCPRLTSGGRQGNVNRWRPRLTSRWRPMVTLRWRPRLTSGDVNWWRPRLTSRWRPHVRRFFSLLSGCPMLSELRVKAGSYQLRPPCWSEYRVTDSRSLG